MDTRRSFLKKSLVGVAAMATASVAQATDMFSEATKSTLSPDPVSDPMNFKTPLKVSIFSYSFYNGEFRSGRMNAFSFLEACKYRYGLDTADFCNCSFPHYDVELDWIKKLKVAIDERELYVPNVAADWCHILPGEKQTRAEQERLQDKYIEVGKLLQTGFVRFDAGGDNKNKDESGMPIWTEQEFDYLVKRYRQLAQKAYDNGFKAGAENHMGPEAYWKNMEKLCKAVDHPGFAMCCHFGGWAGGDAAENELADKACAKYCAHTHIAWATSEGPLVQKIKDFWEAGYDGYYSIEQHSGQNELNLVGVQLNKVKSVLQSLSKGGDGTLYPR